MTHAARQAEVDALVKTIEQQRATMDSLRSIIDHQRVRADKLVDAFVSLKQFPVQEALDEDIPEEKEQAYAKGYADALIDIARFVDEELDDYRGTRVGAESRIDGPKCKCGNPLTTNHEKFVNVCRDCARCESEGRKREPMSYDHI